MKAVLQQPFEPRKQPRQARSVATVSAVLEGAAQVLEAEGYEKMTTTRVAERAGTSVGTLYQYYPSKEAILVAVMEEKIARVDRALSSLFALPASTPLAEKLRTMITALIAEKAARPRLAAELSRQAPRLEKLRVIARTLGRAHGIVRALLEGHTKETTVVDADLAAWLVVHAVNGMVDGALLGAPERMQDPRFADAIVAHVLGSLGAKPLPGAKRPR